MKEVLIVGGGLSGLACARALSLRGIGVKVFEANPYLGGRASTAVSEEGFLLDRGFQVLLTAYPEAQRLFDYDALKLGFFLPGAIVRMNGKFYTIADPLRAPRYLLNTVMSPIGSLLDKVRVGRLQFDAFRPAFGDFTAPESTTLEALRRRGFSERFIDRFYRPFFGGIFLESDLSTSDRMFEFVFKMFTLGFAALPTRGMGALGEMLGATLPAGTVECSRMVRRVSSHAVQLESGESFSGDAVVVATDAVTAEGFIDVPTAPMRGVINLYFSAPKSPLDAPFLVLNGEGRGLINNLAVPSDVSPSYAPSGSALISVTVLEQNSKGRSLKEISADVVAELKAWFGNSVSEWRPLGGFTVARALPIQSPPYFAHGERLSESIGGVFRCGDYMTNGSIQGALRSGRKTAEAIAEHLTPS